MFSLIIIRISDIFISLTCLVLFFPIFILISLLIILFSGFPVFYISKRIGYKGAIFVIYKFRSIKKDIKDEPTSIGKYLRRSSLDELPQLVNILLGEMSIVGPRPLPPYLEAQIDNKLISIRRFIKPGLTGLSQINFQGNKRTWDDKILLDIKMIKNYSFFIYIKIIFLTIPVLFKRFFYNKKGKTL